MEFLFGTAEKNPTRKHEVAVSTSGLIHWVRDSALPWLWCRLVAVALIRPLAWEPPYAMCAALKSQKKKKETYDRKFISKVGYRSKKVQVILDMYKPLGTKGSPDDCSSKLSLYSQIILFCQEAVL